LRSDLVHSVEVLILNLDGRRNDWRIEDHVVDRWLGQGERFGVKAIGDEIVVGGGLRVTPRGENPFNEDTIPWDVRSDGD
jgi:hypothetical protein